MNAAANAAARTLTPRGMRRRGGGGEGGNKLNFLRQWNDSSAATSTTTELCGEEKGCNNVSLFPQLLATSKVNSKIVNRRYKVRIILLSEIRSS